jgi:isoleucyl-tRNA synthetase
MLAYKLYQSVAQVVGKYGADALRLYLINSPVVRAESLKFVEVTTIICRCSEAV